MSVNAETLMEQAGITAAYWMRQAIKEIDEQFGDGYAKNHPELISGFMNAASNDQLAMYQSKNSAKLDNITKAVYDVLSMISNKP